MLGFILFLIVVGIVGGFVARAIVPGRDPMSLGATLLLGIAGSFVGGFLGYVLTRKDAGDGALQASGIVGSIVGSIVVLLAVRMASRRHLVR